MIVLCCILSVIRFELMNVEWFYDLCIKDMSNEDGIGVVNSSVEINLICQRHNNQLSYGRPCGCGQRQC